jgi:hypothetical protein
MNNSIKVLTDISNHRILFFNIDGEFAQMAINLAYIGGILPDKSKWAGDARDKCENINNLLQQYEQSIRPIVESLGTCLAALTEFAGSFADESRNVQKIRSL